VLLLAAFVWLEARSKHALVPLRVFRNRSLAVADVTALLIGAGMFAMWFYVSLYLQQVLGFDALHAGFAFVPGSAMIVLGTMLATRALAKIGPRPLLLVGPFVAAIGLAWLSRFPADGSYTADVLGPLMLLTFGMGLAMTPLAVAGTAGMPRHEAGLASGLINTSRQVGGAIGLAALSTISAHIAASHGGSPKAALAAGFSGAMIGAAIALAAAGLVAALLPRRGSEPVKA
jgi:predicted MFS family arabinose efflux permease